MSLHVDEFLETVKARAGLPFVQATNATYLSNDNILAIAYEELTSTVTNLMRNAGGKYGARATADMPLVAGLALYDFPDRSQNDGAITVWHIDTSNRAIELPEVPLRTSWHERNISSSQSPVAYTIEDDQVRILPTPQQSAGYIRIYYWERFPKLASTTSGKFRNVSIIPSDRVVVTTTDWPVESDYRGRYIDIIDSRHPHRYIYRDQKIDSLTSYSSTTDQINLTSDSTVVETGATKAEQYIAAVAGYSFYIPIPYETHGVLVSATVRNICESLGDETKMAAANASYERAYKACVNLLEPRVRGASNRVVDRQSPMREGIGSRGRR